MSEQWVFRSFFFITLVLHAIIHSLGFIKAFEINEVEELKIPISKLAGFLWALSALLILTYALFFGFNLKQASMLGLIAVLVSQVLIFYFWQDAKIGTIPNVLILLVSLVGLGQLSLDKQFNDRVENDFVLNNSLSTEILSEQDIAHLPQPIKKYIRLTKSIGQPKVKNVRVEMRGGIRSSPGGDPMKFNSVQYNFFENPSRYYSIQGKKNGIPASGLHLYQDQTATFEVKLLNWYSVVDAKGEKLNQAETVTLLNDMCIFAPAALIDKRISWKEIDDRTVDATFNNGDISVCATLYFSYKGKLIDFLSDDRPEYVDGQYESHIWSTPLSEYKMFNGYYLPSRGKALYRRPERVFVYGEIEITSVEYNLKEIINTPPETTVAFRQRLLN